MPLSLLMAARIHRPLVNMGFNPDASFDKDVGLCK